MPTPTTIWLIHCKSGRPHPFNWPPYTSEEEAKTEASLLNECSHLDGDELNCGPHTVEAWVRVRPSVSDPKKLAEEIAAVLDDRWEIGTNEERSIGHEWVPASRPEMAALILPLLERAREEWAEPLEKALRDCTDDKAERLAEDMDHANKDHSRWYKAVKRARRLLVPAPPEEKA